MAQPTRTTKQIAERFKGNLDYYKKAHYLRRLKFIVPLVVTVLTLAAVLAYHWFGPLNFYNSGPISMQHAGFANDCRKCHEAPGRALAKRNSFAAMDSSCLKCHKGHDFHEPNVPHNYACVACHLEHKGKGPILPPDLANCASCHGSREEMDQAAVFGRTLPPEKFEFRPDKGLVVFHTPRPERGYTQVFHSFATDHPEFQVNAAGLKESNTLKFGHRRHLNAQRVNFEGRPLDCAFCHSPDASGEYNRRITFEANCRACHELQFDENNPRLTIPHGDASAVRAFLHSLDTKDADHARKQGIVEKQELETFVSKQMLRLQKQDGSGENLEARVFFSDRRTAPAPTLGPAGGFGPAKFAGCAYCHEVKPAAGAAVPKITPPLIPDRWLVRGAFHHEKHSMVACARCHDAAGSDLTSDILMPKKATCAECHSPAGHGEQSGVRHDCALCHSYHTVRK